MLRLSLRRLLRTLGALPLIALSACTPSDAATPLPNPVVDTRLATAKGTETAVLAGGCFWGVQAVFQHVKGVTRVISGYSGGAKETAEYYKVGSGSTGHAESVQITYDPSRVTYGQLLKVYFSVAHDPGCALQPLGVAARPRAHDEEDAEHEARGRSGSRHIGTGGGCPRQSFGHSKRKTRARASSS